MCCISTVVERVEERVYYLQFGSERESRCADTLLFLKKKKEDHCPTTISRKHLNPASQARREREDPKPSLPLKLQRHRKCANTTK
jgi:hypothetical protein